MDFDLVVRGGTLIDGTGSPGRRGDVGVLDGKIVELGKVEGTGREEIDADGLAVTPGFVDGHTHMDAQVFWDELGSSSCWHGVTTAVMGNCGFTLAPARAEERSLVVRNLERAEDIPAAAIEAGVAWSWSSFAEYLDAVDALPKGLNYAAAIGHSALRTFAMGERAFTEHANAEDLAVMERELSDALHAGAAGFTSSRSEQHETSDDRPVASRLASWDELKALVELVGRESRGSFEMADEGAVFSPDPDIRADYYRRLIDLAVSSKVPILVPMMASWRGDYDLGLSVADAITKAAERDGQIYGLTHCRGVGVQLSFQTRLPFDRLPEWKELRAQSLEAQRLALRDPLVRRRLVDSAHHSNYGRSVGAEARKPDFDHIWVMDSPYLPNSTLNEEAARRGVDPVEAMIDIALERNFEVFFTQLHGDPTGDTAVTLMRNPKSAMTFSDSGAHVSQIVDSSIQSHLLAYWVRERQAFTLEEAVSMITRQSAALWGLHDRGVLRTGCAADLTIFDPATVAPQLPTVSNDLPGGGRRLVQKATGYAATIVNGTVLTRDGVATDARPGRLLRSTR